MRTPLDALTSLGDVQAAAPPVPPAGRRGIAIPSLDDGRQNVYNLSAMTAEQAAALLRERERAPCVRLYRRWDGTVMTADCPVGVRRIADDAWRWTVATFAAVLAVGLGLLGWGMTGRAPFMRATMGVPAGPPARAGQGPECEPQEEGRRPDANGGVDGDDEAP
jgi:hypothetical protein